MGHLAVNEIKIVEKIFFSKMEEDFNSIFDENQETNNETNICLKRNRVILHFDIDCFYAQVEMIKDPSLASKPLGIQQKNIVVTCNYIAREKGVGKCTWIPDAKKACPELVLVNGEDLADYRRWSQQIFDLIYRNTGYENFIPLFRWPCLYRLFS